MPRPATAWHRSAATLGEQLRSHRPFSSCAGMRYPGTLVPTELRGCSRTPAPPRCCAMPSKRRSTAGSREVDRPLPMTTGRGAGRSSCVSLHNIGLGKITPIPHPAPRSRFRLASPWTRLSGTASRPMLYSNWLHEAHCCADAPIIQFDSPRPGLTGASLWHLGVAC